MKRRLSYLGCLAAALLLATPELWAEPSAQPGAAALPKPAGPAAVQPTQPVPAPTPALCSLQPTSDQAAPPAFFFVTPSKPRPASVPGCVTVDDCEDMCFGDCPYGCLSVCLNLAICECGCRCIR